MVLLDLALDFYALHCMYVCSIIDSKIPLFPFYKDLEVACISQILSPRGR